MARPGIAYEQVAAAADAIKARGDSPTIAQVRTHLGTGSNSTIHRFLRQWEESRPTVAAAPVEMPPAIHSAIVEEIRRAVATTRADLEQKLAEARATADELAATGEGLEITVDDLTEKLTSEQATSLRLVGKVEELSREIERVKGESITQVQEVRTEAAGQVQEARDTAQREREAAESARQALARAELRLEGVPRLEAEIERLRERLEAESLARVTAEKQCAVLTAQLTAAEQAVADAKARAEAAEKSADAARQAERQARFAEQAVQARLEAAAREVEAAKAAAKEAREEAKKSAEIAAELRGQAQQITSQKEGKK